MYIIRHKITKEQLGKHYSTAGTAKGAFKTAYMMYDKSKGKYLKFSEQDIYEVVKEETPEMVALEEAVRLLREAWAAGDRNVFGEDLDKRIEQWLGKQV